MKHLWFFGMHSGTNTAKLAPLCQKWAKKYGAEFVYKEISPDVRAEYNIEFVPMIRFFDESKAEPRVEAQLSEEILRFIHGGE